MVLAVTQTTGNVIVWMLGMIGQYFFWNNICLFIDMIGIVVGEAEYFINVWVEMSVNQTFQQILWCVCLTARSPCVRRVALKSSRRQSINLGWGTRSTLLHMVRATNDAWLDGMRQLTWTPFPGYEHARSATILIHSRYCAWLSWILSLAFSESIQILHPNGINGNFYACRVLPTVVLLSVLVVILSEKEKVNPYSNIAEYLLWRRLAFHGNNTITYTE